MLIVYGCSGPQAACAAAGAEAQAPQTGHSRQKKRQADQSQAVFSTCLEGSNMPYLKKQNVSRLQPSQLLARLPAAPLPQPTAFGSPLPGQALRGIPVGSQHVPACSSLSQRAAGHASDVPTPPAGPTSQQHRQQATGARNDEHPLQSCPPGSTHHQDTDQSSDAMNSPTPSLQTLSSSALVCHGLDMDGAAPLLHDGQFARGMDQHINASLVKLVSESHEQTALLQGMRVAQDIHAHELTALIRQACSGQASDPGGPLHAPAATFQEEPAELGLAGRRQLGACLQHSMDMILHFQRSNGACSDNDPNNGQPNGSSGLSSPPASVDQPLEGLPLLPGFDDRFPARSSHIGVMSLAPSTCRVCLHLRGSR